MTSVDSRIVTMKFDNAAFERGVKQTMTTMDRLKEKLGFSGAAKGLDETAKTLDKTKKGFLGLGGTLDKVKTKFGFSGASKNLQTLGSEAVKTDSKLGFPGAQKGMAVAQKSIADTQKSVNSFTMEPMEGHVDHVSKSFVAMSTIAITAISKLTSVAMNAGGKIATGLFGAARGGLEEYETNLNSVQTILANTQASGAKLSDVNSALKELNTYSDKTIYNFAEMARNIGTFTAAGVDLKQSTASIKGIANLAALSGSNSEQASTAMYQLSQAISSGRVGLQDWNSVVNAGMGGSTFQRALAQTAVAMGDLSASAVKLDGPMKNVRVSGASFRDSIMAKPGEQSWLTSKVLVKTLQQFTGDMSDAQLAAEGFTKEQIKSIQATAKTAFNAATKVKTLSGVLDVAKESAGSGWAATWQIVFGDFKDARKTFTALSTTISGMISNQAKARNKMLTIWAKNDGRENAIKGLVNIFHALGAILKPIGEAWREAFPPMTGKQLAGLTETFAKFTKGLIIGKDTGEKLKRTFAGVFGILSIAKEVVVQVAGYFLDLFSLIAGNGSGGFLDLAAAIGDIVVGLQRFLVEGGAVAKFFDYVQNARRAVFGPIIEAIGNIASAIGSVISVNTGGVFNSFESLGKFIKPLVVDVAAFVHSITTMAGSGVAAFLNEIADIIRAMGPGFKNLGLVVDIVFGKIQNALGNVDIGGGFNKAIASIRSGLDSLRRMIPSVDLGSIFDMGEEPTVATLAMKGASEAATASKGAARQAKSAWGGLGDAFDKVKEFAQPAIEGVKNIFRNLKGQLMDFTKGMGIEDALALVNTGFFIALYTMLRRFLKQMSGVAESLSGTFESIGGTFDALTGNLKVMQQDVKSNVILKIAVAIGILAAAIFVLSKIPAKQLASGLVAIAILLRILTKALDKLEGEGKVGAQIGGAARLILMANALTQIGLALVLISAAIAIIGNMKVDTIKKGLISIGIIMAGITVMSTAMEKSGGGAQLLVAAGGLMVLSVALVAFAGAIKLFSMLDTDMMKEGLLKIALTVAAIMLAMRLMPAGGMIAAAASLGILALAMTAMAGVMKIFATFSIGEMAKSLIMLGGSLAIMAIAMNAMANPGVLAGAIAMGVMSTSLATLIPALVILGNMSIGEIAKALGALAAVFVIFGLAGLLLAPVVPVLLGLGVAMLALGAGVALMGGGLVLFAAGLAALAASGAAGAAVLTGIIVSWAQLFPLIMHQFGLGLIAFAAVIRKAGPKIIAALGVLLGALFKEIIKRTPGFAKMLGGLISAGLKLIREKFPEVVRTGIALFMALQKGVRDNIGKIVTNAVQIVVNFMNALGKQAPKLVDAGYRMLINFMNGLSRAIDRNREDMGRAGVNLAVSILNGMVSGFNQFGSMVNDAVGNMASNAINTIKDKFHIFSPSRVTHELGGYVAIGMANGINAFSDKVETASGDMANGALSVITSTMSRIPDMMSDEVNVNPVITPVLDLTKMANDANKIGTILGGESVKADVSLTKATDISNDRQSAAESQAADTAASSGPTEIKFEQNNYSPKALSAVDIYRNGKSQIALAKEALNL